MQNRLRINLVLQSCISLWGLHRYDSSFLSWDLGQNQFPEQAGAEPSSPRRHSRARHAGHEDAPAQKAKPASCKPGSPPIADWRYKMRPLGS